MNFLLVAVGGFIGSIIRFYLSTSISKRLMGTWTANITGSILLAFSVHYYYSGNLSEELWLLLGVGFCGAYTTFSTFGNETLKLILEKRYRLAMGYVISSLLVSISAVAVVFLLMS